MRREYLSKHVVQSFSTSFAATMNVHSTVLLLLTFSAVVVRPGVIETPDDSQALITAASNADQQVLNIDASDADKQLLSPDASDADQLVLSTDPKDAYQQALSIDTSDADQQVMSTDPSDADQQVLSTDVSDAADHSDEERIRSLRIEMLKIQILSKLNMKNPPPVADPPSGVTREAVGLLLQQEAADQSRIYSQSVSGERVIIHAEGDERECLQMKENSCKMFCYEISASLYKSAVDLWIYKLGESPKKISVAVSFYSSFNERKFLDSFSFEQHKAGWNKLPLSILLLTSWNDTVSYQVEINGDNIEHRGDRRPLLMVSKSYSAISRRRRDVDCDTDLRCCMKPLRVSFDDIRFSFVHYPHHFDANYCDGTCGVVHENPNKTHYERAMTNLIEKNATAQEFLGDCWVQCCKPKQLAPLRVLYHDMEGNIHDSIMTELIVQSCSCS